MHLYIGLAHLALAFASCGGFFFGRYLFTRKVEKAARNQMFRHYQAKYNEQMGYLCNRYNQERVALIHRFEGLTAELEREIEWLKAGIDPDRTKENMFQSAIEEIEATDLIPIEEKQA